MIDTICYEYNVQPKPRTYRQNARKDYLSLAKRKKRTGKLIRKAIKKHTIRISGPPLGRPRKDPTIDKKREYQDAVDRIEVERNFSLAKRCYGLGLIRTKLDTTTRSSIALSIIAMNVNRLTAFSLCEFLESIFQGT